MRLKRSVKKAILRFFLFILTIAFLATLGYSGYKIYFWYQENKHSENIKELISDYVVINETTLDNSNGIQVDFDKLKEINKDVIGFLKVYNTKIEYPVVKAKDNEYYLKRSFDKSTNSAGWIFANYHNTFDGSDKNISIFGHARLDGSMFGSLKDTLTSSWQNSNPHSQVVFITENEANFYEVFSTYRVLVEDYYIQNDFVSTQEFEAFLDILTKRSNHDYNVTLTSEDEILTLSTCDIDNNYRLVLHARKVQENN